jgi:precorrin-6B methylase 2
MEYHSTRRLRWEKPELYPIQSALMSCGSEIRRAYDVYVNSVGSVGFTISFETASYSARLLRARQCTSILDLGSGFSSYVTRQYARNADYSVICTSVDTENLWLERTRQFLESYKMKPTNLVKTEKVRDGSFDLIFSDSSGDRNTIIKQFIPFLNKNGIIIFDDMQDKQLRIFAEDLCADNGLTMYSIRNFTRDYTGRFARIATRK